ncbi:MAG: LysM peptidoglycan-binding domain-containing protein [Deltaproteobacteria bacterium]|nr:LysM peptidoglycan-binding domain-containing protein [Deltaproteobacteria bacterium]
MSIYESAQIRIKSLLWAGLAAWLILAGSTWAQEPADSTITLTKTVEVYTFEDLTFSIDSYTVAQGDNLAGVLKKRGLWPTNPDAHREAQIIRLIKRLNPAIANPDLIAPGQELYLPTPRAEAPVPPEARPEPEPEPVPEEVDPPGVVSYSFVGQGDPGPLAPPKNPSGLAPPSKLDPGQSPINSTSPASARSVGRRSSEPEGELEMASDGTVYRKLVVRKGDTLEKLLRREGVDPDLIYKSLIKVTLRLNPELKNPNIIVVGAELRVPSMGAYLADLAQPTRVASAPSTRNRSAPGSNQAEAKNIAARSNRPENLAGSSRKRSEKGQKAKFTLATKRLPPAPMPTVDAQNARTILGVIFTRLGATFTNKGRLFLPLDEPPHFDVDTASSPIIELKNGRRIVLDLRRAFSPDLIKRFSAKYKDYLIFQPTRGETLEKVLERLWPLCAYYRIYNQTQTFEGGSDIRLKIAADWLIWPTAEDWNRGQPVVINLAPAPDNATPQAWVKFLGNHGVTVIDLYKGLILADATRSPTPINNFTVIDVDSQNPSSFAAALVKSFGFSPRLGLRVDLRRGRIVTGGENSENGATPAVFWETGQERLVLEYGDLSSEDLAILKANGFQVISSGRDSQLVLKSILSALNIKLGADLVLNGDSAGGPALSLTISGQSFAYNGRSYLFTQVDVPDNLVSLDPNQNTVVLRYQAPAKTAPINPPANAPARANSAQGESRNAGE